MNNEQLKITKQLKFIKRHWFSILGLTFFGIIVIRSFAIPPYMDEIFTYFNYLQTGSFQPEYSHIDANNHLLNSLFGHLSYLLFGDSMWSIRLPNTLSFLLYFYAINKIRLTFNTKLIGNAFGVTLLCSMYVLSFFSLARGYGLSIAFLTYGIYCFIAFHKTINIKFACIGIFTFLLSSSANLALLPISILFSILFILTAFTKLNSLSSKRNRYIATFTLVATFLPFYYLYNFSSKLRNAGLLYHGHSTDFIKSMFINLPNDLMDLSVGAEWGFVILTIVLFIGILMRLKKPFLLNTSLTLSILFFLIFSLPFFMNLFMGINYPQGRTGLHYFILFLVPLFLMLDEFPKLFSKFLSTTICSVFCLIFVFQLQFTYAPCWKGETVPITLYETIQNDSIKKVPTVVAHGILGKALQHQGYLNGTAISYTELNEATYTEDYILTNSWYNIPELTNYDTTWYCATTSVVLLKKNKQLQETFLSDSLIQSFTTQDEFIGLFNFSTNNSLKNNLKLEFQLIAQIKEKFPKEWRIVVEVKDVDYQTTKSTYIDISKLTKVKAGKFTLNTSISLAQPTTESTIIQAYLWNPTKQLINFHQINSTLFYLSEN